MLKNPPAKAGDTGSIPGPGRSHMPRSNEAHAPQPLSPCVGVHEAQLLSPWAAMKPLHLEPTLHSKRSHRDEMPTPCNKEQPPRVTMREKPVQQQRPSTTRNNKNSDGYILFPQTGW